MSDVIHLASVEGSELRWWSSSDGRIELQIRLQDAEDCSHSGDCEADVRWLLAKPYIQAQLGKVSHEDTTRQLQGYGAWDADELADEDMSRVRLLWMACGDIADEAVANG